jgi:hypothetical protein
MSCKAEIIVAQYDDAVYIPVQAVLRVGGKRVVFVVKDGSLEERTIEVGLDDNRMIRIVSGLEEGEVVLMTPPLRAATIEPGSSTTDVGSDNALDASDTMRERVNQKLEEANGNGQSVPGQGRGDAQSPPADQMRRRIENMSPEQRRQRFENMTDEEREQMRQRFQGAGRQGRGSRQGGDQGAEGGQRPRSSERNQ